MHPLLYCIGIYQNHNKIYNFFIFIHKNDKLTLFLYADYTIFLILAKKLFNMGATVSKIILHIYIHYIHTGIGHNRVQSIYSILF